MSEVPVELGFLELCEPWQVESRLFPSKVGGKPAWLNLHILPGAQDLQCKKCQQVMIFLCQIYAPYEENLQLSLDNYVNNFHRTIFVFVCRNSKCCERNNSDNIKVLRSSLQRDNKFYSYDPPEDKPNLDFSLAKWANLCNLCGCLAEKQCSKCKKVYYCSREHQVLDWKEGHKKECGTDETIKRSSNILFSEWEVITEPEELQNKVTNEEKEMKSFQELEAEGKTGTLSHISELHLNEYAEADKDRAFNKFQKQVEENPDQIIRYKRGGEPLWIAKEPVPSTIPNCEYCGGTRRYEFQIMPQILTLLNENGLDWGVLAVYTCENSCTTNDSYKEEFIFKQNVEIKNI